MPLIAMDGLGEAVAINVVNERKSRRIFISGRSGEKNKIK